MASADQPRQETNAFRGKSDAVRVNRRKLDALANRQWGVASLEQLGNRGIADPVVRRWLDSGRLHPLFRGVFATVHPSLLSAHGWHAAAVLLGGDDARLCASSAAWWAGVLKNRPADIHVAVTNARRKVEGIRWHRIKDPVAVKLHRMPITALERIPLDLAASLSLWDLKGVLAELEYHYDIGPGDLTTCRGYAGSRKLRRAIAEHTPQLAHTRSELEEAFIRFLVAFGFELPEFNAGAGPTTVDAIWAHLGLVVELDGSKGHASERRLLRDHRRDLHRRAEGKDVLRYHYTQIVTPADQLLIAAELERYRVRRVGWAA